MRNLLLVILIMLSSMQSYASIGINSKITKINYSSLSSNSGSLVLCYGVYGNDPTASDQGYITDPVSCLQQCGTLSPQQIGDNNINTQAANQAVIPGCMPSFNPNTAANPNAGNSANQNNNQGITTNTYYKLNR
jgi:hypothetical protein